MKKPRPDNVSALQAKPENNLESIHGDISARQKVPSLDKEGRSLAQASAGWNPRWTHHPTHGLRPVNASQAFTSG